MSASQRRKGTCLVLTLPWPPTTNNLYPHYRGRRLLSTRGRQYYREAGGVILAQLGTMPTTLTGALRLALTLHAPTRQRYDIDNRVKAILDVLEKSGVIQNDHQVDELHIYRGAVSPKQARVEVRLTPLEPPC